MHPPTTSPRIAIHCSRLVAALLLAVACEPAEPESPTPTPSPSAPATVTESPGSPTAAGSVCDLLTEDQVADFLGGDIISATDRPASGEVLLGGCEWIATNSTSLRIDLRNLAHWEEGTTGTGWEQVGEDPNARFSDISGLAYRADGLDAYILVRVGPGNEVETNIAGLQLFLGA
jgi:hypothetical protein